MKSKYNRFKSDHLILKALYLLLHNISYIKWVNHCKFSKKSIFLFCIKDALDLGNIANRYHTIVII